jgi:hypothetical protein
MGVDPAIRQLVGKIHEQSTARYLELHPDQRSKRRPIEIKTSFILGTGSAALATVVAVVTLMGLLGRPFQPLSEPFKVISQEVSRPDDSASATSAARVPNGPQQLPPSTIHLPSLGWRALACVAEALGIVGILLGGRHRVSLLSVLGVLLALVAMAPVIGCELMMTLR